MHFQCHLSQSELPISLGFTIYLTLLAPYLAASSLPTTLKKWRLRKVEALPEKKLMPQGACLKEKPQTFFVPEN